MESTTIAAIATAPGRGAIGIVRLSGANAQTIGEKICRRPLTPRYATYTNFVDGESAVIDQGLALFFPGPNSFTGEDCVELQGHGGPVILDQILQVCLHHGAVLARPGQFSERAFLNDKIDLTQAEAIADLIDASSQQSAANALHSLQGIFSKRVNSLADHILRLRMYIEAAIDFPEEEIDFLADKHISEKLQQIIQQNEILLSESHQGVILRDGIHVVIAGLPNAGKSSLLNCLAQKDSAIVTDIAGTTRDVLREHINIDGLPIHIVDTAGIRDLNQQTKPDAVEAIGIERAQAELEKADLILWLVDSSQTQNLSFTDLWPTQLGPQPDSDKCLLVYNKTDLSELKSGLLELPSSDSIPTLGLSTKTGQGTDILKDTIKNKAGLKPDTGAGFTARRRHLDALDRTLASLNNAQSRLAEAAGELSAEDLRIAHQALGEITGQISADDLLGEIFSSFCIGK